MDFGKLLDLAKKNQDNNKDQLKRSKDPVLEFKVPGREVKSKPNLSVIQARLQAHQERLRREEQQQSKAGKTAGVQNQVSKPSPLTKSGTNPSRPVPGNVKPKPNPNVPLPSGPTKPSLPSLKTAEKPSSSKLPQPKPVLQNGKPSGAVSDRQTKPSTSSSRPISDRQSNPVKLPSKPVKLHKPPGAPTLSFQEMLRLAQQQQPMKDDVPLWDPLKMKSLPKPVLPPPPSQKPSKGQIRPATQYPSAQNAPKNKPVPRGKPVPGRPVKSSTFSSKPESAHMQKKSNDHNQRGILKRPDAPVNGIRNGRIQKDLKPVPGSRTETVKRAQDKVSVPQSGIRIPSQTSNGVKRDVRGNPVSRVPPNVPPGASQRGKPLPYGNAGKVPLKEGSSVQSTSSVRQPPKSAYPEKFDPFKDSLKKRPKPAPSFRAEEEEEDYDDEMDDFIDDTPYEDDYGNDYSAEIRKMFRYDPRRYVGREELDDIDNMESDIHQQWKEEAISAFIGRKEDEREEELERQELARERAARKKAKLGR